MRRLASTFLQKAIVFSLRASEKNQPNTSTGTGTSPTLRRDSALPRDRVTMILFMLWLLLLSTTRAAATCYSYEGKELDMYPCDATAKISPCCGSNDYCLSNGLCLNAGGNNAYTQQGCTDKGWGFPCQKYCPGSTGKNGISPQRPFLFQSISFNYCFSNLE